MNIMMITGAGISAGSGLPTYRGAQGRYTEIEAQAGMPIEQLLSPATLSSDPACVWRYWLPISLQMQQAQPSPTHLAIKALARSTHQLLEVTQNVDGLSRALIGDERIIELHGSYRRHRCTLCGPIHSVLLSETMALPVCCPRCRKPEAIVRPDVVMFGERIDQKGYDRAQSFVRQADILIIAGTTLQFSYLANLIAESVTVGALVIYVDPQASPYKQSLLVLDQALDIEHKLLCIRQSADEVLPQLSRLIIEGASQNEIQAWCGEHAGG